MREKNPKQLPFLITGIGHQYTEELQRINDILDENPIINGWILQDHANDKFLTYTGAEGMIAEYPIRATNQ